MSTAETIVRPWRELDAPSLLAAWLDPEIARWNPVPERPTIELAQRWITGPASQQTLESAAVDRVMVFPNCEGDEIVGEIGIRRTQRRDVGDFGCWITAERRGEGLGLASIRHGVELSQQMGLRALLANVDVRNTGAIALFRSAAWRPLDVIDDRQWFASDGAH